MDDAQIPPDYANGQPGLFPEHGNQADQIDPQTLLPHHHTIQLRRRYAAASAPRASAGDIDVLGNLRRDYRQVDDLPSALRPAAVQPGFAVGTALHHVRYPPGGCHPGAGKAVGPRLAGWFGLGRLPLCFGFQTRHPAGARWFGLAFQLGNALLQPFNDRLLSDDDSNENVAVSVLQVNFRTHTYYMA